jgi:hypothetical protein
VTLLKSSLQPGSQSSELNPKDWSHESFKLAREKVYLSGELKGGSDKESAQLVPEDYGKESRKVGEERVVLAGYRLAGIL